MRFPWAIILGTIVVAVSIQASAQTQSNGLKSVLVGDSNVQVLQSRAGSDPLPKPERILVFDFNVPPELIAMDESVAGRMQTRRSARRGINESTPEQVAQHVKEVFSRTLLQLLASVPIPSQRQQDGAATSPIRSLVIRGEFLDVDQGNATRRIMIGFGRGASSVRAHVTVWLTQKTQSTMMSEFYLSFASSKKPGALATMGVGSLAVGAAAGDATDKKASVESDTKRMAKAVSKQLLSILSEQKWIPAPQE